MDILRFASAQLFIFVIALTVFAQSEKTTVYNAGNMSDEDLISKLSSDDETIATQSAIEIFKRKEKSIPFLLKLKGNRSIYRGYCLGDPKSADFILDGVNEENPNDGSSVTIEAASLYLISAIYYDNLAFANTPYLIGSKSVKDFRYNTPQRIKEAWKATEKWHRKLEKYGLAKLRDEEEFPLKSTEIHFLGTNPGRKSDLSDCGK